MIANSTRIHRLNLASASGSLTATFLALLGIVGVAVAMASYSAVDNTLTVEDREYIGRFLEGGHIVELPRTRSYRDELSFIVAAQTAVLEQVSGQVAIPFNAQREPENVFKAKSGLCYDRSRVIEKILRSANFETRHIAIYSTKDTGSRLISLLTPQVASHAVTEVLTQNGWLVVDSNQAWVSYDRDANPVNMATIQSDVSHASVSWHPENVAYMNPIFREPFTFIYGLYSRHGKFYPPYNPVPDIHYGEFVANFL